MNEFNPNNLSQPNGNYFALPYNVEESSLVIISAPYDATTSYKPGSCSAPDAIIDASAQIDLYDIEYGNAYEKGIATLPFNDDMLSDSKEVRKVAEKVISYLETGGTFEGSTIVDKLAIRHLLKVNESSDMVNDYVYSSSKELLDIGKSVALVGGDHSTPFGLIKAISEKYEDFGILHIDAHADLREAYEGFKYSHASIMYNVIKEIPQVSSLIQVGVRDFCQDEFDFINSNDKICTFFDAKIAELKYEGTTWNAICDNIIEKLPHNVYVSFDIDGLHPAFCPGTGTPVPGGLEYNEAIYLITKITRSGRGIIGFDVNEVAPTDNSEWDANVGARVLYKLSLALLSSKE